MAGLEPPLTSLVWGAIVGALVWAVLLGWLVFGDFPGGWSLAGMGIIVLSGLYLANRQRLTTHRA